MAGSALTAGASYFAAVFAVGFVFGTIRVGLVAPLVGEHTAEILELPLMLVAVVIAARWIVRRFRLPAGPRGRLPTGLVAFVLLLVAESLVLVFIRQQSLAAYLDTRASLAGALYAASLVAFALMPLLAGGAGSGDSGGPV